MRVLPCYAAPKEGAEIAREFPEALMLGVSMSVAAMRLTRFLAGAATLPEAVLLFGVGGAYPARHLGQAAVGPALVPGDLAWIARDRFVDLGVRCDEEFLDLQALGLEAPADFSMHAALSAQLAATSGLPLVSACTVATAAGDEDLSARLATRSAARVESMEGAAVAMVCAEFGLPFVQLRAISNFTGERARAQWALDPACDALRACAREALRELASRG